MRPIIRCDQCEGTGYDEDEHSVVRRRCSGCNGSGHVASGHVDSDTYRRLPYYMKLQADAVAQVLEATGAYRGIGTDLLTDAAAIVLAARFAPPVGDNHHNAALCPYCTPRYDDRSEADRG